MSYPPPLDPNRNFDASRNQPVPGQRHISYPPASRPSQIQADRCPICKNVVSAGAVRLLDSVYHSHCALAHANAQIAELYGRIDQIVQAQAATPAPVPGPPPVDGIDVAGSLEELNNRLGTVEANQGGKVGRGDLRDLIRQINELQSTHNTSASMISGRLNDLEDQINKVQDSMSGAISSKLPTDEPEEEELEDDTVNPAERWDGMSEGARTTCAIEAEYKELYCQVLSKKSWADLGKSAQKKLKKVLAVKD